MPSAATIKAKSNGRPGPRHNIDAAREEFYQRISKRDMMPSRPIFVSATGQKASSVRPYFSIHQS